MERLLRDHSRQVIGGALCAAALIVLLIGYANIRDEAAVAVQMPYVLTGGIGSLILAGLGMLALRSQDDRSAQARMGSLEATNAELSERVDYLTQLIEAALLPDETTARKVPVGTR